MTLTLRPLVIAEGSDTPLTLSGLTPGRSYRLTILPTRERAAASRQEGTADEQGRLRWTQSATWRGEALCDVFAAEGEVPAATLRVYAAEREVLRRRPLRADLHLHTTYSDGRGTPAEMVVRGRELGLDVVAVTDHNDYQGSTEAIEVARRLELGMTVLPGEEVSAPDWHLLAIGARGPIGAPVGRAGYAGLRQTLAQIHGLGGRAYLAHPYWTYDRCHHLPPQDYDRLLAEGGFDGLELIGDVDWQDNLRSLARYGEACLGGRAWPILGCSDAHAPDHTYGGAWTLVLAADPGYEGVLQAIGDRWSVACTRMTMAPPGQRVRPRFQAFGPFELVDLALFLDRHYFPEHDALCREEAALARRALAGDHLPAGSMARSAARLEALYRECWGLEA